MKLLKKIEKLDENSMEKLNFYLFLGKFVAKISTSFFDNNFSPVLGGG